MESGRTLDEIHDLKALIDAAKSERLRRVLGAELRAALAELSECAADLREMRELRSLARRPRAQRVLDREARELEKALEGTADVLRAAEDDGLVQASPSPDDEAPLPDFCWRSPHRSPIAIDRIRESDGAVMARLQAGEAFVLTGSRLCAPAVGTWSSSYLSEHFGETVACTVYESSDSEFRYWDLRKNLGGYPFDEAQHTRKLSMSMREFRERTQARAEQQQQQGGGRGGGGSLYLQTALVEGVGERLLRDFSRFDWQWVRSLSSRAGWGPLSANVLFVGSGAHVTPLHFDEQQTLLAQLRGRKRVLLWRPRDWPCLYPFPLWHPHDRQSQLSLASVDLRRHPRFADAQPLEAVLEPGNVLVIPRHWWHHVECLGPDCVSLNFWFTQAHSPPAQLPISEAAGVALRRNIEQILCETVGAPNAHAVLRELGEGRPEAEASDDARKALAVARPLLRHVFTSEAEIDKWLQELCAGRFW